MKLWRTLIRNLATGPATRPYPRVPLVPVPGARGQLRLIRERCIFCRACEVRCPAHALAVDSPGRTWSLDPNRCIFCHFCVECCPCDALYMEPLGPVPGPRKLRVQSVREGGSG